MIYLLLIETEEDRRKFEIVYKKYRRLMAAVAYEVLNNYGEVEDVIHDSFEKIANNMHCIGEAESKETRNFVTVIAKHTAIDFYRKKKMRIKKEVCFDELKDYQMPHTYMELKDDSEGRILKVLTELPDVYKEVLTLRYVNHLPHKDIARILGIREGTVRTRITRGKKMIEDVLNEMLEEEQKQGRRIQ